MNIQEAKDNVMKNLTAELEKVHTRNEKPYFFEIGKFVKNAMDAIEAQVKVDIDSEFLSKAVMFESVDTASGKTDVWQITKKEWNRIVGRGNQFIEPGELPKGYVAVKKGKSKRVSPFNRTRA